MSIIDINSIDSIGVDNSTDTLILAISDHLTWEHEHHHIILLEEKISVYLQFINSGELYNDYPDFSDKILEIKIFFIHKPPFRTKEFIRLASYEFSQNNMNLSYELIKSKTKKS